MAQNHVSIEWLLGFAAGRLAAEQSESVQHHLACGCHECMQRLDLATCTIPLNGSAPIAEPVAIAAR